MLIFVIVKFSEGAWLVVVLFIIGVPALIRLNRQYRMEATVLENIGSRGKPPEPPTYSRRTVFVFIDDFDLATIAGAPVRPQPAADLAARRALRHRQRPGRQAAAGLDAGQHRHRAGLRRLPGPAAGQRGRQPGERGGGAARRRRDRGPAAPQLRAASSAACCTTGPRTRWRR